MMPSYYIVLALVRVLLPAAMLISIALRPFGLSIIYVLLFLLAPLPHVPVKQLANTFQKKFIVLTMVLSCLLLTIHAAWHSILVVYPPYGSILHNYTLAAKVGYNLGLVSYESIDSLTAFHYLAPELIMTFVSIIIFCATKKLMATPTPMSSEIDEKYQMFPLLVSAGKYISLLLIMISGILRPSVISGIYFLTFMGAATAWSVGQPLEKGFAVVCRCLMAIMGIHVLVLMAYQVTWVTTFYPPSNDFARYFGLTKVVELEDDLTITPYVLGEDGSLDISALVSPLVILLTYYVLAVESRALFKPKEEKKSSFTGIELGKSNGSLLRAVSFHRVSKRDARSKWASAVNKSRVSSEPDSFSQEVAYSYIDRKALRGNSSETAPLLRTRSLSKRILSKGSMNALRQDSSGSIILRDDDQNIEEEKPTLVDEIATAIIDFFQVLIRSSYIATTITMMGWSILYHSWLTFIFLMWANIVWLRQDQRSFMLKTSPVLVVYAMFLLIAQYVYEMDLTESELPSNITAVNLHQIGLGRTPGEPCVPLLIKSLFTCMFWVTLRQRVQDIQNRRQAAAMTEIASPLQVTVSTAASEAGQRESRLLHRFGSFLRAACAAYWIYVVVIMLFVIGITGERMTIFRIIYMFLFLAFILMFQISWYWWRRLMYMFWIVVIIYSMINLILIYIYQFDNFATAIENYLYINKKLQNDLGLEPYPPADLFVKLLTPTLFLIITIMQVHYFHKDFMALSDPKSRSNSRDIESSKGAASTIKDDIPQLPLEEERPPAVDHDNQDTSLVYRSIESPTYNARRTQSDRKSVRSQSYGGTTTRRSMPFNEWAAQQFVRLKAFFFVFVDKLFIYLDLHLIKIIMVSLMLLCVFNVCAMHVPIMIIICPALLFKKNRQRYYVLLISILISIYFMAKMVYQIEYIVESYFEVNCSSKYYNESYVTLNNAEWIGFEKATAEQPLVVLLKGYIALIATFTFYSLVRYRQQSYRERKNLTLEEAHLMFPKINRVEADRNLLNCCKYLLNYGFYKFGVEITLVCLIGVIGSRMDVYAVAYAIWLLVLVSMNRRSQARLWKPFIAFIMFVVPVQYLLAVGFLPQLCVQYPWWGSETQMKHVRNWLFLPYAEDPPHASKLIFDYILLMFACLQLRVFRIEQTKGHTFAGGSNSEDIDENWETPNFVNPVPDFLGFVGTWLDVIKRMVFLGMLWVTLAIMFMTGTNRVNLFSMGYLIGSFIFLWQGTDFYLLPKEAILQWWSWLLRYNVSVVVIKTLLQIPGCIYGETMQDHACWLVQLLGIGCVDKFTGGSFKHFIKMEYSKTATCTVPQEDIGLAWDGVCFAFLILQRRLFHSNYFYRVIDESKATTILASRGAELIEELRQNQMRVQEEQEIKILEKIKVKMERIKANQKKIQGVLSKEPRHHDAARECPPYRTPPSHQKAVRSGDYYMFEDFDDTDIPIGGEEKSDSDDEAPKDMGLGKLLSMALKTDLKSALVMRRASTPMARTSRFFSVTGQVSSYSHEGRRPSRVSKMFADLGDRFQTKTASRQPSISEQEGPPEPETWFEKILRYLETAWAFVASFLVSLTRQLMRYSRDYRYMSRTLTLEKKVLKEKEGFGIGLREGSQQRWEPLPETLVSRKDVTILEEQDDSMFKQDRSPIVHLMYALWYTILAHTDIVCYIMVFINQIQSATILSIPLPLMVFLWGTLTVPRPTKTFWVTLIAYTEVIVLIKSMFQFEILPWNQKVIPANMPFTAPRIIGIERKNNYALYDLLLLLIIFLHRFMLKSLGLWKETTPDIELREDMEFQLKPEDTQKLVEGHGEEVGEKYIKIQQQTGPYDQGDTNSAAYRDLPVEQSEPGPSKPHIDDHFKVDDDQEPIIAVMTTMEDTYKHYPEVVWLSVKRYLRPMERFFKRMLAPGARVTADIYAYMFLCDFINFLVVIFGFAAFGTHQGDGGVQTYLEENKVPIPFLVMLILQFGLIVIDRALYLRKFMLGKILFQFALIIGVHIWMFFILPFITERTFNTLPPPPIWYMVKCIYLLLSAYQIRCGYPRRIIGNFLCKSYRFLNMVCFRGFMGVPFVFELRTLMDWIWTDTSMTLMDWLKMEDIFANVFLLKCSRQVEDEFPQPRGRKKSPTSKYLLGGGVLAFVIAIIWFPLVFFAFGNTVGEPNPPTDVTVKIRIGPFLPVYQMSAQSHNIITFTEQDYAQMSNMYARDRTAQTFLSNYMYNDVAAITISPNSTMKWTISPPELDRLEEEAASNSSLSVQFAFVITHPSNTAQNPPTIESSREVPLEPFEGKKRNPERQILYDMLTNKADPNTWLTVKLIFPKFLKVFNKGTAKPAYQLMPMTADDDGSIGDDKLYRDIQLRLERDRNSLYWRVRESCGPKDTITALPLNNCNMLVMYTFNDKLFPETLNFISGGGIIGLYTTFVFLASRVIRGFFSGIYTKIMFDDLPNVDRVLQLCLDIYLVREAVELSLEEDLFAKLVFLYRSPETMIKWTRPREEDRENEQQALPPSR